MLSFLRNSIPVGSKHGLALLRPFSTAGTQVIYIHRHILLFFYYLFIYLFIIFQR